MGKRKSNFFDENRQTITQRIIQKIPGNMEQKLLTNAGAYGIILYTRATVAQLVEQLIRNQQVAGSSPASSSKTP